MQHFLSKRTSSSTVLNTLPQGSVGPFERLCVGLRIQTVESGGLRLPQSTPSLVVNAHGWHIVDL